MRVSLISAIRGGSGGGGGAGGGTSGGRTLLYKGDVTEVPVVLAAVAPGSAVQIAWSRDRGILGPGSLTQGGVQTLWILGDGSADYGGAPPSLQYHWSCVGGVITLWLDTLNTTARAVVELLPEEEA